MSGRPRPEADAAASGTSPAADSPDSTRMARTETAGVTGRFAPSPTGPLHVGNLRTALLAWLLARSAGEPFLVRMEDLDRVTSSAEHEAAPARATWRRSALDWDGAVVRQSERFDRYDAAIDDARPRPG